MKSEGKSLENLGRGTRQLLPRLKFSLAMPGPSGTLVPGAGGESLGITPHVGTEAGNPGGGFPPAQVRVPCLFHLPLPSLVGGIHH